MRPPGRAFDPDAIDVRTLRGRLSAKYQAYPADVLPLWIAEMDFPLAEPIAAALHAAVDRSDTGYRSAVGVAQALAQYADRAWSWTIDPSRVLVLPDVLTALARSLIALTEPGDGVVVNPPVYPPFYSTIAQIAGRAVVTVPLARTPDGGYRLDLDALATAFARPEVTAYVLCSPHNPTGTVPTPGELAAVAELAQRHGVLVIADEIHAPLTLAGAQHTPYLTVAGDDAVAVSAVSASKAWNIAGLKCAQVVATRAVHRQLTERTPIEALFGTGHLGAIATVAAYLEGDAWLADVRSVLEDNRALLTRSLADRLPDVGYLAPAATYLAWLDLRAYGLGDDPSADLLARGRVALSAGTPFGPGGDGHVRVNFATSASVLGEAIDRMARVLAG